jgi:hypothetical protein
MAIEMTGSGNIIFSRMIGLSSSQSVSPVRVSRRPTAAYMLPALHSVSSSRLLACMRRMRPIRSRFERVEFETIVPLWSCPE